MSKKLSPGSVVSFVRFVFQAGIDLRNITKNDFSLFVILQLQLSYLKIKLMSISPPEKGSAVIAGYDIEFCEFSALEYSFNEVFVNQEYAFSSNSNMPCIVDAGSNIGLSVLYFKMLYPNSTIKAFEPSDANYLCLKNNIENNNLSSVSIYKNALSDEEGELEFFETEALKGALVDKSNDKGVDGSFVVQAVKLSPHIEESVDLLKMDIEGAELEVLQELESSGKLKNIKQIVLEYHHIRKKEYALPAILSMFIDANLEFTIGSVLRRPLRPRGRENMIIYAHQQ